MSDTPITDAAWQNWVENGNPGITLTSPMAKLERDRAALIKALELIATVVSWQAVAAKEAIAKARANFPTENHE